MNTTTLESLNIVQRVQLAWSLFRDDRVGTWVKRLGPAALIAYVVSPIDLIPDMLIGPGQMDDLGVIAVGLFVLLRMLVQFAPDDVVDEHVSRITGRPVDPQRGNASSTRDAYGQTIDTSGRVR